MRIDVGDRTYVLCRDAEGDFHCLDGLCTHERVHLADGLVFGNVLECPMHNGQFDCRTGAATRSPACIDLATYPVKLEGEDVFVDVG